MSTNEKEASATASNAVAPDDTVTDALMVLLEARLDAFMGRADLSSSPPADKVAIRAAYFLGVAAGMQLANTISGADGEEAGAALDKQLNDDTADGDSQDPT